MTIIAVDWTHIAADGICLDGTVIRGLGYKKLRVDRERRAITAMAGTAGMHDVVHDWMVRGADIASAPQCFGDACWTMLLVDPSGLFLYTNACPYGEEVRAPFAIGADCDMAMGIMLARDRIGHAAGSAQEAVELVCQHTNKAGGDIQCVNIAEVTGFTLPKLEPKLNDDMQAQSNLLKSAGCKHEPTSPGGIMFGDTPAILCWKCGDVLSGPAA